MSLLILGFLVFSILAIAAGIFFFMWGSDVFSSKKKQPIKYYKPVSIPPGMKQNEVQLMICPQCAHTYKDLAMTFCLEDGQLLRKTAISMPPDPEATIVSGNFK